MQTINIDEQAVFPDEDYTSDIEQTEPAPIISAQPTFTQTAVADTTNLQTVVVRNMAEGIPTQLCTRRGNKQRKKVLVRVVSNTIVLSTRPEQLLLVTAVVNGATNFAYASNGIALDAAAATNFEYIHESADALYAYCTDPTPGETAIVSVVEDTYWSET